LLIPSSRAFTWTAKFPELAQAIPEQRLDGIKDESRVEDELVLRGVEFEGFPRQGKQLVHHAREVPDGEHHVN